MAEMSAANGLDTGEMQHSGAGLLVIIGEPFSEDFKELIVAELTKGFKSWDINICDVNAELAGVSKSAGSGEEGTGGERIVTYSSDCLQTEILVNPQCSTVKNRLYSLIGSPLQYKYIIFAGHMIQASGAWVLQDDTLGPDKVIQIVKDTPDSDLQDSVVTIHCLEEGDWSTAAFSKQLKGVNIHVNPEGKLQEIAGVIQFTAYVNNFINVQPVEELLQPSEVVGNIRFSKPTLYIFPGGQGDSALFGISGFNLLVNGGFNRKACFWDFTRHLDRIDAILLTHLGSDNIFSVSSVMQRKAAQSVHPEIGYVYYNSVDKIRHSESAESARNKTRGLLVNVIDEGNKILENLKLQNHTAAPCVRSSSTEPINLYHKVGHGSLDMYVLNPQQDSKELKDFLQQWSKRVGNISAAKPGQIPIPDSVSVCALLVWQPANKSENITRILFPGNVPQQKVFEGLDKLKNLEFLKYTLCTHDDLGGKKKATVGKPSAKAPVSSKASKSTAERRNSDAKTDSKTASKSPSPPKPVSRKATDTKKAKSPPSKASPKVKSPSEKPSKDKAADPVPVPVPTPKIEPTPIVSEPATAPLIDVPIVDTGVNSEPPPVPQNVEPVPEPLSNIESAPSEAVEPPLVDFGGETAVNTESKAESLPDPITPDDVKIESLKADEPHDKLSSENSLTDASLSEKNISEPDVNSEEPLLTEPTVPDEKTAEPLDPFGDAADKPVSDAPSADLLGDLDTPQALPDPSLTLDGMGHSYGVMEQMVPEDSAKVNCEEAVSESNNIEVKENDEPLFNQPDQIEPEVKEQDHAQPDPIEPEVKEHNHAFFTQPDPIEPEVKEQEQALFSQPDPIEPEVKEQEQAFFSQPDPIEHEVKEQDQAFFTQPDPIEPEVKEQDQAFFTQPDPIEPEVKEQDQAFFTQPDPIEHEVKEQEQALFTQPDPIETEVKEQDQAFFTQPDPIEPEVKEQDQAFFSQPDPIYPEIKEQDQAFFSQPDPIEPDVKEQEQAFFSQPDPIEPDVKEQDQAFFSQPDPIEPEVKEQDQTIFTQPDPDVMQAVSTDTDSPDQMFFSPVEEQKNSLDEAFDQNPDDSAFPETSDALSMPAVVDQAKLADVGIYDEGEDDDQFKPESGSQLDSQKLADLGIFDDDEKDVDTAESSILQHSPEDVENANVPMEPRLEFYEQDAVNANTSPEETQESSRESSVPSDSLSRETPDTEIEVDDNIALSANPDEYLSSPEPNSQEDNLVDEASNTNGIHAEDESFQPNDEEKPVEHTSKPSNLSFDPLKEWDEPMGLPSPPPPDDKAEATPNDVNHKPITKKPAAKKTTTTTTKAKNGDGKVDPKKKSPTSPTKPLSATTKKTIEKKADTTLKTTSTTTEKRGTTSTTTKTTTTTKTNSTDAKRPASAPTVKKTRPSSVPVKDSKETIPKKAAPATAKPASAKTRPASVASTSAKPKPLPPVSPSYVDLTYVPNHGNAAYCDLEFFRRVRARYYVISSLNPSAHCLNALLEAKQTWEDKDLEVTVIPTYDNDTLRHWMGLHRDKLSELKIDVAPSASRCTIQLQDHETSCAAYRLEF